ncbi:MAG: hypothetical protein M3R13_06350 [Armatimonadota bacterium]|nr:hypothetical protein [Armatimonadota bacterium]
MNTDFAKKLIDLYLDGHMDMEMVSDFREAMRADATLAAEVDALREMRENLLKVYGGDGMTNDENRRVYHRLMRNADPSGRATHNPAGQLEIPWSDTKHE